MSVDLIASSSSRSFSSSRAIRRFSRFARWRQLYKIGYPGKSILGDYFQENWTSRRPFLLLRISFPGRPIFIQFVPGTAPRTKSSRTRSGTPSATAAGFCKTIINHRIKSILRVGPTDFYSGNGSILSAVWELERVWPPCIKNHCTV